MLRSERDLARKRDVALHANGRRQKHRLTSHNFESLANEIKQLAEQVLEEAGQLAEEMTNPPSNSQCSKPVNEEHSRREQMLEIESRESEEDKLKVYFLSLCVVADKRVCALIQTRPHTRRKPKLRLATRTLRRK
jgi:hypothetical protein